METNRSPVRERRARPQPRPHLLTLLVAGLLAAVLATPAVRVETVAHKPFCLVDTDIPDEAYAVEEFARTHNYSPPPGLKGGRPFTDDNHALPALLRPYKEHDVYPPVPGAGRPSPRIVLSDRLPYTSWYSPNHYGNFMLMFPPGCLTDPTRWVPRIRVPGSAT